MSIYYSGGFSRSGGIVSAIGKQLKSVNLKAIQRITVTFDPFSENAKSAREILFHLSAPKVSLTNPKCVLRTEVVCNRQPSEIKFLLNEQARDLAKLKEIKLLSDNLTTLELLQLCNQHISVLAPKEDLTTVVQTKSEKKQSAGVKRIVKKK